MGLSDQMIKQMHKLANAYAAERIEEKCKAVESWVDQFLTQGPAKDLPEVYKKDLAKLVGNMLASSYAKGFADSQQNFKVKELIF